MVSSPIEPAAGTYEKQRREHWSTIANWRSPVWKGLNSYYHRRLAEIYCYLIPPGSSVLELGCGEGDLLAALQPGVGVGVDFAPQMIATASRRYPDLHFAEASAEEFDPHQQFDFIILSDLVNDLWDVQLLLERLQRFSGPQTRIVLNTYSRLWELPRKFAERTRLAAPLLPQNWLTTEDLENLLELAGFETIRHWADILWPIRTPLIDRFENRYLVKLFPFRLFALANFLIARPKPTPLTAASVSIIVPARNEQGNIENIFQRTEELGDAELIFVEGNSTDQTAAEIQRCISQYPHRNCRFFRQTGTGKGDAVRLGFEKATGNILMILDADLTVAPEDLSRFYNALASGTAEFVNGVRLVYPMDKEAMRFFNLVGNKFFSLAFSWLLGQNIKDTLCGTKVFTRANYERIAKGRAYFGEFDPFGDFDLIFGAAKCNLKMVDMPVRYHERIYGQTNINRWRDGATLLRMVFFALRRIKFV
ncbi:MAG: glycosyltransferase [Acidobacteriia bacterium]|nr:glycosyltransferase [Terriglobia bacterium]